MKKLLEKMSTEYNIAIDSHKILREGKDLNTIIFIQSGNNEFIAKLYKDEFTSEQGLITQGKLCDTFIQAGLPFAKRHKTIQGDFYTTFEMERTVHFVTLEDYMSGTEIKMLDIRTVQQIGRLLAKMHHISEQSGLSFGYGTTWSLFGGNATDKMGDYDENELCFHELHQALLKNQYDSQSIRQMKDLFDEKRERAKKAWAALPKGPIQGDFCPYNMVKDPTGKITGIFDLNIAGDEVFINELCALAIYFAYHFENNGEAPEAILRAFMQAYALDRPLAQNEIDIADTLFQIIRPFRFDRVDSIVAQIDANKRAEVEAELKETTQLLDEDYNLSEGGLRDSDVLQKGPSFL